MHNAAACASAGQENADKCAWTYGSTLTNKNGARFNVVIGVYGYMIQRNWQNTGAGQCVVTS